MPQVLHVNSTPMTRGWILIHMAGKPCGLSESPLVPVLIMVLGGFKEKEAPGVRGHLLPILATEP